MPMRLFKNKLLRHLVSAAKSVIPRLWKSGAVPSLMDWVNEIHRIMKMEELTATLHERTSQFLLTWTPCKACSTKTKFFHDISLSRISRGQSEDIVLPKSRTLQEKELCRIFPMEWSLLIILAIWLDTGVISEPTLACPERCTCLHMQRHILCNNASLTAPPAEIANDTVELYLQHNTFASLNQSFLQDLPELRSLFLSNCAMEAIQSDAFQRVTGIQHLYLDSNELHSFEEGTFDNLSSLIYLHLERNKIDYLRPGIFSTMKKLNALYLSHNLLKELPDNSFKGLTQLRWLDLGFNMLLNISRKALSDTRNLRRLNLEMNNLTSIPSLPKGSLQMLRLSGNTIKRLSNVSFRRQMKSLTELYMDNMGLEKVTNSFFSRLRLVDVIDLRNNSLASLPVSQLRTFTKVYLTGNPWRCDCSITDLYVRQLLGRINDPEQQVLCQSPKAMEGRSLSSINILKLTCEETTTPVSRSLTDSPLINRPTSVVVATTTTTRTSTATTTPSTPTHRSTSGNVLEEDACLADQVSSISVMSLSEEALEVSWSASKEFFYFQILYSGGEDRKTLQITGEQTQIHLYSLQPGTTYTVCVIPQNTAAMICQTPKPKQCATGQTHIVPAQASHIYSPPKMTTSPFVIVGSSVAAVVLLAAIVFTVYSMRLPKFGFQRYHNEDGSEWNRKQDNDPYKLEGIDTEDDRHIYVTASSFWGTDNGILDCSLAEPIPVPAVPQYVTLQ
ncbi:uncharacterized protein PAF06_000575 [Gastrophryne carolinensis]